MYMLYARPTGSRHPLIYYPHVQFTEGADYALDETLTPPPADRSWLSDARTRPEACRLVADRFRDRRVFVCGDAAHLWIPHAGYGMNAGIADAANLSWLWPPR